MTDITTGKIDANGNVIVGNNNHITTNLYHSADWQAFLERRDELQDLTQARPDNAKHRDSLAKLLRQMEDFKRDVLKLAEDFQRIPLNTERLKLAYQHFEGGNYQAARAVLNAETMTQEQNNLLARQRQLNAQQAEVQASLDDKASEFLLLAQLRAIDYSLGDQRIVKTCEAFDQALKSGRTPDRLFYYAKFLRGNNQFKLAEEFYREALANYRKLAANNPTRYLPDVANVLNNLGILVKADSARSNKDAEKLYTEALGIQRNLAADNPSIYLPDVARTLNNLGTLVAADNTRREEAETLFTDALDIRCKLAANNPSAYLPDVAITLNNLGAFVSDDNTRSKEAETHYTSALYIQRNLAVDNPNTYLPDVAKTLNNLGTLVATDNTRSERAETLYIEVLDRYRKLAIENPSFYLPYVAGVLNNLGALVSDDSTRIKDAEKYYTEALGIQRELVADNPSIYLPCVARTLNNLGMLVSYDRTRRKEVETIYIEALSIRRKLADDNPNVYLPDIVETLGCFGYANLQWGELVKARAYLQEAAEIIKPFATQYPNVYGDLQNTILHQLAYSSSTTQ